MSLSMGLMSGGGLKPLTVGFTRKYRSPVMPALPATDHIVMKQFPHSYTRAIAVQAVP